MTWRVMPSASQTGISADVPALRLAISSITVCTTTDTDAVAFEKIRQRDPVTPLIARQRRVHHDRIIRVPGVIQVEEDFALPLVTRAQFGQQGVLDALAGNGEQRGVQPQMVGGMRRVVGIPVNDRRIVDNELAGEAVVIAIGEQPVEILPFNPRDGRNDNQRDATNEQPVTHGTLKLA